MSLVKGRLENWRKKDPVRLLLLPSLAYIVAYIALHNGPDQALMAFFYDPASGGFPLRHGFLTETLMHQGGRAVMKTVWIAIVISTLIAFRLDRLALWRRPLLYLSLSISLSVLLINAGKAVSNMDCPWDLISYGGERPYIGLFEARPEALPRGRCFPGGHSSSGFALLGLFFALRGRTRAPAWAGLLPGLLLGTLFAAGQWARGAHFPSHDLTTAYICWLIALGLSALIRPERRPSLQPGAD